MGSSSNGGDDAMARKARIRPELLRIVETTPELVALTSPQPDEPEFVQPIRLRPPPDPYVVLPIELPRGPGRLFASRVPGRREAQARADVEALRDFGISRVVCLVEAGQLVELHGADRYLTLAREVFGDAFHHLDVRDHDIPDDDAEFEATVHRVDRALLDDEQVLVHCIAGCGRTGMFVTCLLSHQGLSPVEGIRHFRRCRRCGPDTTEQMAYAIRYARRHGFAG